MTTVRNAGAQLLSQGAQLETRAFMCDATHELRVNPDTGAFEGYGLLWNVLDSYGTRFAEGSIQPDTDLYALLWMHDPWTVLGAFNSRADKTGLWIAGQYDDTPEGQAARARAKSKSASELSIGFVRTAVSPEDPNVITGATLVETSQITARMAAVPGAALATVRSRFGQLAAETTPPGMTDGERLALAARLRLATR